MRHLIGLICVLSAGCVSPREGDTWQGTVEREFGEPVAWTGHVFYDNPRWSGYLEDNLFRAGGWIDVPGEGALFAQAGIEVYSGARPGDTPEPLGVGDTIPILHFGEDRGDNDWWAHATWIEEYPDGEIAMRYVFNNTGGNVNGSLTFTDLGSDPETETTWWAADIALDIDMSTSNSDHPGNRHLEYTLRWGPYTTDG